MYKALLIVSVLILKIINASLDSDVALELNSTSSRTLSRRKRYVIFPEGSSFQLVYCLTLPTSGMGQIFTIGLTAALAWELPHEPIHLKREKTTVMANKRVDKPAVASAAGVDVEPRPRPIYAPPVSEYHVPWATGGWSWATRPPPPPQFRPAVKSRRRPDLGPNRAQLTSAADDGFTHLPAYRSDYLYRKHGTVHRRTRRDLFAKIEKFFIAQNKDGRACLLKALCEINQTVGVGKGTFIEEILRAIFTWKSDEGEVEHEDDREYNMAATHKDNCTEKFPTCSQSVWNSFF